MMTACQAVWRREVASACDSYYQTYVPALCDVSCTWHRRDQFTLDLMEKVPQGAGSGTIWDTDGHVVTNAHVIAGASDLQVL